MVSAYNKLWETRFKPTKRFADVNASAPDVHRRIKAISFMFAVPLSHGPLFNGLATTMAACHMMCDRDIQWFYSDIYK